MRYAKQHSPMKKKLVQGETKVKLGSDNVSDSQVLKL